MLSAYLGHVADYNGHDDPIDRHSFTEDDAEREKIKKTSVIRFSPENYI